MSVRFEQLMLQGQQILDKAKADGRELTLQEQADWGEIRTELSAIRAQDAKAAAGAAFSAAIGGTSFGGKSKAEREFDGAGRDGDSVLEVHKRSINHYLRTGQRDNYTLTTGTDSGVLLPTSVGIPAIVRRMWNFADAVLGLTGYSVMQTPRTDAIVLPVMDDSSVTGDTPSESATSDTAADPDVETLTLPATLYSSKSLWLSNTVVNAEIYDLLSYLLPILDKRVALSEDAAWTTKLLTYAAGGNTFVTASDAAITYTEITSAYHKLLPQYRSDACWVLNDSFLAMIESLQTTLGFPLLANSLERRERLLLGLPYTVGLNFAAPAANAIVGALVSGECVKVRRCPKRIARYVDVPTFPDQVGFRQFENAGADFVGQGTAFIKMAAS